MQEEEEEEDAALHSTFTLRTKLKWPHETDAGAAPIDWLVGSMLHTAVAFPLLDRCLLEQH